MQFMRTNLVKTSEEKKEMLGIVLQNSRMSEFVNEILGGLARDV